MTICNLHAWYISYLTGLIVSKNAELSLMEWDKMKINSVLSECVCEEGRGMSKVLSFLSGPFFDNHTIVYPQLLLLLNLQVLKSLPSIYQSRKTSSWQHLVNVLYLCIVLCVVHYCIRHHYIDNDIVRPSG